MSSQQPVYGWAMNFGKGYVRQDNIINTSSQHLNKDLYYYSDGRDSSEPPFYTFKPKCNTNCPYYNYTLPDTYPNLENININKKYYWYFPYDTYDWNQTPLQLPKPS
jgi:hypothetical protein